MTTKIASRAAQGDSKRLEGADWVNAALRVLAERGITDVRIEGLARDLGATKGSFYWHFKDRDALLMEVLQVWRRRATLTVIERLERKKQTPAEMLTKLLMIPLSSPNADAGAEVELAIRLWGRIDPVARSVLEEVDQLRMRYLASIFGELGANALEAEVRAALAYSFMRVGQSLPCSIDAGKLARLAADALTLPIRTAS